MLGIKELGELVAGADNFWLRAGYVVVGVLGSLYLIAWGLSGAWTVYVSAYKPYPTGDVKPDREVEKPKTRREQLIADGYRPTGIDGPLERFEKSVPHEQPYIQEADVRLLEGELEVAAVRVINVHSECYWKFGSDDTFVNFPKGTCPLATMLRDDVYREKFALARDVVLVGLDSYPKQEPEVHPNAEDPDNRDWELSFRRATALARVVDRAHPQLRKVDRHFWVLDLGKANTETIKDDLAEFKQRSVIILGVDRREATRPFRDILRTLVTTTKIGDVDLRDYAKSATAVPSHVDDIWKNGFMVTDSTGKHEVDSTQ